METSYLTVLSFCLHSCLFTTGLMMTYTRSWN